MNTRIISYIFMIQWFVSAVVAEDVSMPERSMEYYDLVAKVVIQAVDKHAEHTYGKGPDFQLVGHPLQVELVETLRKTDDVDMSKLLVTAWTIHGGRRYGNPDLEAGRVAPSNVVSIACRIYLSEATWCVVEWVLTDDMWETYQRQKGTGVVERPYSPEDYDIQQRLDAGRKRAELRKKMKAGGITREEYKIQSAPLTEILSQPIHGSTF